MSQKNVRVAAYNIWHCILRSSGGICKFMSGYCNLRASAAFRVALHVGSGLFV